jgi:hypothetical protein
MSTIKSLFSNRTLDESTAIRQHLPEIGDFWLPRSVAYGPRSFQVIALAPNGLGSMTETIVRLPERSATNTARATELGLQRYYSEGFTFSAEVGFGINGTLLIRYKDTTTDPDRLANSPRIEVLQNGAWVVLPFVERSSGPRTHNTQIMDTDGNVRETRTLDHSEDRYNAQDQGEWRRGRHMDRNIGYCWFPNEELQLRYAEPPSLEGYHGSARRHHDSSKLSDPSVEWCVGWEVEKEDREARIKACRLHCALGGGWIAEKDGSLDGTIGVEFVSPVYDLMDSKTQIADFERLEWVMNASKSNKCGGHITLSRRGMSAGKLLEKLTPYIPMLFALYEGRLAGNYSGVQTKSEIENSSRRAIYLKASCVEIRVPSAVGNIEDIKWRLKLVRWIAKSIDANKYTHYSQVAEAMFDDTKLNKLLSVFYNIDKLRRKQSLTYLFGGLLEDEKATAFVDPQVQDRLLERMRTAWRSVASVVKDAFVDRFSSSAIRRQTEE